MDDSLDVAHQHIRCTTPLGIIVQSGSVGHLINMNSSP
uniref:Uncharacterized protein n=1 Tax=Arundo donax TaxID=35708 RepID=A0A0A9HTR9_ARUDO